MQSFCCCTAFDVHSPDFASIAQDEEHQSIKQLAQQS